MSDKRRFQEKLYGFTPYCNNCIHVMKCKEWGKDHGEEWQMWCDKWKYDNFPIKTPHIYNSHVKPLPASVVTECRMPDISYKKLKKK